mmetsp:Transcript_13204/g.36261  ORF Transcript_13204/g.36261 Transcript_13204/m.36261 type:complete len:651 (-) Transcript_13204:32-1984(-)
MEAADYSDEELNLVLPESRPSALPYHASPTFSCDSSENVAEHSERTTREREVLAALLAKSTAKLEEDLREQLHTHRFLLEDVIAKQFEQFRRQASHRLTRRDDHSADGSGEALKGAAETGVEEDEQEDEEDEGERRSSAASMGDAAMPYHSSYHNSKAIVSKLWRLEQTWGGSGRGQTLHKPPASFEGHRRSFFSPRSFVHGTFFNLLSAALILGNAAFIGYQTHVSIETEFAGINGDVQELSWETAELLFLCFFTLELTVRIAYDRLRFIRGVEWRWNLFDSVIVGISMLETLAASILSGVGLKFPFLRLVRVVRVLRVLKVLHMIPFFRRLGLMMSSVAASLSALAPAFVLLILVIYMFGICVMQGIINYLETTTVLQKEAWLASLEFRFGSINATMITMFLSITGGISWVEVVDGLNKMDGVYNFVYMFYVGFVQICVLNIVTGVFVDTVHQMYQPEREEMVEREAAKRKAVVQSLKALLEEADNDCSGTISWEEFEQFTSDRNIMMYLAAHEIDIRQAREIFDLMHHNPAGEVIIDEFVISLLEFKGAAKGADVVILRNLVNAILTKLTPFVQDSRTAMDELKHLMKGQISLSSRPFQCDTHGALLPGRQSRGKGGGRQARGKGANVPTCMGHVPQGDSLPAAVPS